jgi:hypothetical protein
MAMPAIISLNLRVSAVTRLMSKILRDTTTRRMRLFRSKSNTIGIVLTLEMI